jgi:hypothetical protein
LSARLQSVGFNDLGQDSLPPTTEKIDCGIRVDRPTETPNRDSHQKNRPLRYKPLIAFRAFRGRLG